MEEISRGCREGLKGNVNAHVLVEFADRKGDKVASHAKPNAAKDALLIPHPHSQVVAHRRQGQDAEEEIETEDV